jgi:integrase/recombinase XerD
MEMDQNKQNNYVLGKNSNILELFIFFKHLYLENKKASNLSNSTLNNINSTLERFYGFIANESLETKNLSIDDINKYFLSNYLNFLTTCQLSKNTQKLHLTIIKNFLNYISDYDIETFGMLRSQTNGLKVKTAHTEKKSILENEQKKLKDYLAQLDTENSFLAHRDSLLIKMLLYTGARISEALNIKWFDISETDDPVHGVIYTILLKGKGDKERYTYLLYNEIRDNIDFIRQYSKDSEYVFFSTHGNKCNRSTIWVVIKNRLIKAGIFKTGLHIFRHTCARNLVRKNINLSTVKEILGHTNITVTAQFYARSNEISKKDALMDIYKE